VQQSPVIGRLNAVLSPATMEELLEKLRELAEALNTGKDSL
jgi:hypothetical protein